MRFSRWRSFLDCFFVSFIRKAGMIMSARENCKTLTTE
jgi:hypothetical protein